MTSMLGIEVPDDLLASWRTWLAPDPQPFVVDGDDPRWHDVGFDHGSVTAELRDTFRLWASPPTSTIVWLSHDDFQALPRRSRAALVREQVVRRNGRVPGVGGVPTVRGWRDLLDPDTLRQQADGHRFVWWPHLVDLDDVSILHRLVSTDRLPSRHREVSTTTWRRCEPVLPGARTLAGTWAAGSTANCFSTVMDAAGAAGSTVIDRVEPVDEWLGTSCRPGGDDLAPGTVLLWRSRAGTPVHAAVTIGGGWGLEKPSQEWHSPWAVARVRDIIRASRHPGERLERHSLII